jgi:TonB family protein
MRSITASRHRRARREQEIRSVPSDCRLRNADCGFNEAEPSPFLIRNPQSAFRNRLILIAILFLSVLSVSAQAQINSQRIRVAVLDFGETETGGRAAGKLASALSSARDLLIVARDESRAAASGVGYRGSLNMSLQEARDLGAAIGCDFYITGDAQTLRRSSSARPVYYEAYAAIFLVSAHTGRLITWERPSFEAAKPDEAEKSLLNDLNQRAAHLAEAIRKAQESERNERAQMIKDANDAPAIEDAPEDEATAARLGIRLPQPFRRLRPIYPESAARAEAEATVDVQLELDANGVVRRVEVVRWAGFGLDEATVNTVRQLHFRPAIRDGVTIPMRVLLRYNFRKPAK